MGHVMRSRAADSVRSPSPCGEGSGVGVGVMGRNARHITTTPLPNTPPQGGRERRHRAGQGAR